MSKLIRGKGGHFVFFLSAQKNTNLVEDIKILFSVKFVEYSIQQFRRRSRKCEKLMTTDDGWKTDKA